MRILKRLGSVLLAAALSLSQFLSFDVKASEIPFEYVQTFLSNGTFTAPNDGLYQFYVIGPGGNGGKGGYGGWCDWEDGNASGHTPRSGGGGGAGGFGGYAIHRLQMSRGQTATIQVSTSQTKLIILENVVTANKGGNGTDGENYYVLNGRTPMDGKGGAGGSGGAATGGNISNYTGNSGQAGSTGSDGGSAYGGRKYIISSVSGGVFRNENSGENGKTTLNNNLSLGCPGTGGGGGSARSGGSGGYSGGNGGTGTLGGVVVDVCTDTTPPVIDSIEFSQDHKSVIITGSDEYGVAGFYVNGEFHPVNPATYSIPAGTTQLTVRVEDNAGNISNAKDVILPISPVINISPTKEWMNAADAVVCTLSKDSSQIDNDQISIWYSIHQYDQNDVWKLYSTPVQITDNCTLKAKAVIEKLETDLVEKVIKFDKTVPAISSVEFTEDAKNVTITGTDDGGSGFKGVYVNDVFKFADENGVVSVFVPDGVYSLTLQAMDAAGNKSEVRTEPVPDVVPPTIDSCTFAGGGLSAVIKASDKGSSGLKGIYVNSEFFEGDTVNYTLPDGITTLDIQAEDNAGNKSEIRTETIPDNIPPVIESVEFSQDNKTATILLSDTGGSGVKGATINGEFFEGSEITYAVPDGAKYLEIQAVDKLNNTETMKKRVPGWSQIVDTITFKPVEFRENNKIATITAETSLPNTTIAGIYINDVLYPANPTIYKVPDGLTTMQLQAVNNEGDKSVIYNVDVPAWGGGVRITSVSFSEQNDYSKKNMEAYIKAVDDTGHNIKGIYVNGEFFEGDAITYTILNGTRHLEIQAINTNGDTSEVVIKRVPGWSEVVDTLSIESVTFASSGIATITAASTGAAVSGIYVNDKFYDGNPVLYTVSSGTKTLKLQAENKEGDKSAVVYKEVSYADTSPIVSTLAISAVDFDGSIATVKATSTGADVSGIYVNDKLYDGNPVLYPVSSSTKTLKTQAVNIMGERSPVVYKEVPSTSSSSSTSTTTSGKARISISAPDWTSAKKAKVKIAVSDSNDIDTVTASTDYGTEEDVTDEDYIYITKDTTVKVEVKNDAGEITKKSTSIECFDRDAPTVSVSQSDKILNIKASDAKSGVAAIYVKGKKYASNGQVSYNIPDGATSVTIYAEDEAGNKSDAIEYPLKKEDKPVTAVPVAGAVTSVTPTPTAPAPEPEPEADGEIQAEEEPEYEQPFINLLGDVPEGLKDKKPSMAGVVGSIAAMVLSLGGIGAWMWHNHKKAGQSIELDDMEDLDIDYDQEEQNPDDAEDGTEGNDNVVDFNNERKVSSL